MANSQIVHVNDTNFQYEVLSFSQNTPVVVEFWASWCRDCRTLYPELEQTIHESYTHIRLAKINVDKNPNTTLRYSVRSLPSIKAFSYARIVDQVTGMVPKKRLLEMLTNISSISQNTLTLEKAMNLFEDRQYTEAEKEFNEFLEHNPDAFDAILGLSKTMLTQHKYTEAEPLLSDFPTSKLSDTAKLLHRFTEIMLQFQSNELPRHTTEEATFHTALRLIGLENYQAALDGLLDILRKDKSFRNGDAKTTFLAILEIVGEERINKRKYRMELSSVLF